MKILWAALAGALAALGSQPVMAYDESLLRPYAKEHNQSRQRGQENSPSRPWESRPWESRPWQQQNATDERRRPGKKTRNERFEQKAEKIQESRDQNQAKRPNKWQRHHMESERFNPGGLQR